MNILIDTNVLVEIASKHTNALDSYYIQLEDGEKVSRPDISERFHRLIGNNTLCSTNLIREEFVRVAQRDVKTGDISKEAIQDVLRFLSSAKIKYDYSSVKEKYVTKTDLEQQNDQRIYISASDNGVTHILTHDHHFPPFTSGFSHICKNKVKIMKPNKKMNGFFPFLPKVRESYSNSMAGRLLERLDRLLNIFR